jgi:hypothetical protein
MECRPFRTVLYLRGLISIVCFGYAVFLIFKELFTTDFVDETFIIFLCITALFNSAYLIFGLARIVIHENGLMVWILTQWLWLKWDRISLIKTDAFQMYIFSNDLPLFGLFIGLLTLRLKPAIRISRFSHNYNIVSREIIRNYEQIVRSS